MAVVTWGTVRSLLIFFGPMLLPKAINWYRTARNAPKTARKPIVPLPRASLFAILLLSLSALTLFILGAVPRLAPENLFTLTRSNPTTSTNLLAARLATLRPLTAQDEIILHTKFESKASRLLYYKYGPDALANCPFCTSQDPTTYLLYAIPSVAMPHLLNAVLLGLSTSHTLANKAGAQWRNLAIYAAAAIAAIDFYALAQWDHVAGNDKARILAEVFFFHWVARTSRFVTLAALQLTLAGVLYLSSTNRMFVPDTTASERIEGITAALGMVNLRIRSANVLKNTVSRDAELRAIDVGYWAHEGVVMQEAMESMEVVESMRDAVENRRIDPQAMEQAAEAFAQRVMGDAGVDGFAG